MNTRRFTLPALASTAALGIVALTAGAASAHVTVAPSTTAAGAYAVLTFSLGHGCEGSPTTKLTIAMPEEIPQVTPTVHPNWTVEKVAENLDEPATDAHGNELAERVAQVVYTAKTPLADGYRDTVELSVKLPETAGETLAFPVVQSCAEGETGWIETAADGEDADELELPAPTLTITEATGDSHQGEDATGSDADARAGSDDDDSNALAIGALGAGLGGLVLGGVALARTRRA